MAYQKTNWVNDETPLNADNMNNIENGIEQNESDIASLDNAKAPIVLTGTTDPTTSTIGVENQLYRNTTTNTLFICTGVSAGNYTWLSVGGGSGKYLHNVTFTYNSASFMLSFISTQSASYTTFSAMCTDIYNIYANTVLPVTISSQGAYGSAYGSMVDCRGYVPSATSTYFEFFMKGFYLRSVTIDNVNTNYVEQSSVQSSLSNNNVSIVKDDIISL